jgi:hypothetical protein
MDNKKLTKNNKGMILGHFSNLFVSYNRMVTSIISSNGFFLFVFLVSGLDSNEKK